MASDIYNITVDCFRPYEQAAFWAAVLGLQAPPEADVDDAEVGLVLEHGGELLFQRVSEPKVVKNRLHLCLRPDTNRAVEVDGLLDLGASLVDDRRERDGTGWAVLGDPEDHEFCVLRSAHERQLTSAQRS